MRNSILWLTVLMLYVVIPSVAQFAPSAGLAGSTAMPKDTSIFLEWASTCVIERGYMDIALPDSGYVSVGDANSALGTAGQNGVISLGDGGTAILTFSNAIYNGDGFDFAVFENGFDTGDSLAFLEFAFVEVSSDGNSFYRFPATSFIQDTAQIPMSGINCVLVNNLAGKYTYGYGTPFDLEELKDEPGLDVNHITHVKLIDVVGSVDEIFATYDNYGHKINDPYPTPYPSSGFDLDAVGVIHAAGLSSLNLIEVSDNTFQIYPNVIKQDAPIQFTVPEKFIDRSLNVYSSTGNLIQVLPVSAKTIKLSSDSYPAGLYFISIGSQVAKLIVQ